MTVCSVPCCPMPSKAHIYPGLVDPCVPPATPCEGHIVEVVDRMIAAGRPFRVVPWQLVDGVGAAA